MLHNLNSEKMGVGQFSGITREARVRGHESYNAKTIEYFGYIFVADTKRLAL